MSEGFLLWIEEPVAVLAAIFKQCLLEDRRLVPAMVGHEVADNPQSLVVGLVKQLLIILPCAEVRIDIFEIQGVIPVIVRRLEDRREHDGCRAKVLDVIKLTDDALQVSPAEDVLTLWRHLPASVESVDQQMIDSDIIKPVIHNCLFVPIISRENISRVLSCILSLEDLDAVDEAQLHTVAVLVWQADGILIGCGLTHVCQ